jgi:hypothetical protein
LRAQDRAVLSLRSCALAAVVVLLATGAYLFGLYSYSRGLWPMTALRGIFGHHGPVETAIGTRDRFGHLAAYPGKTEVACPEQTADTAFLLVMGQSNAANHGDTRVTTHHPESVLNFFAGKCYVAASPLLGATGEGGEFVTPLADELVDRGVFRSVIVMNTAVTDTQISRWQRDGDLNLATLDALRSLRPGYRVTQVVWHQGENDLRFETTGKVYQASFRSMLGALRDAGVDAPVFLAVATTCGRWRRENNDVATAQRALVDDRTIFLGADTDALLDQHDRSGDACHLSGSGARKTALAYAAAIEKTRR